MRYTKEEHNSIEIKVFKIVIQAAEFYWVHLSASLLTQIGLQKRVT
jgi:hypothetical protein